MVVLPTWCPEKLAMPSAKKVWQIPRSTFFWSRVFLMVVVWQIQIFLYNIGLVQVQLTCASRYKVARARIWSSLRNQLPHSCSHFALESDSEYLTLNLGHHLKSPKVRWCFCSYFYQQLSPSVQGHPLKHTDKSGEDSTLSKKPKHVNFA